MRAALVDRYLDILGVPDGPASGTHLEALVDAHLRRVPFENVSKIHNHVTRGLVGIPETGLFLDGIEEHGFGGTCYTNNYHLHCLLRELGYRIRLCGADMSNPDAHLVNVVEVDERPYLVDGGYGAPFFAPLPLDLDADHEISWGIERYVLRPRNRNGRSCLEQFRDGERVHRYVVNPAPRRIEEFDITGSYLPDAMFMTRVRAVRFFAGSSISVLNRTVEETRDDATEVRTLGSAAELVELLVDRLGMDASIVAGVVERVDAVA